jgi:hypothetical protein
MVSSMLQDTASNGQDRVLDKVQHTGQYSPGHNQDATRQEPGTRATVHGAAYALGMSFDALRKRIQRGTIPHERHEDGHERLVRYGTYEFVESLQDQIEFLRRELERKDAILVRMAERVLELEASQAPQEPREAPETASGARIGEIPPRISRSPSSSARGCFGSSSDREH